MSKQKKLYPVPEALGEGPWDIEEGAPKTELNARGGGGRIRVPLGESEEDRILKLRQMAYAKWHPRVKRGVRKDVPQEVFEAAESARINELLTRAGFWREVEHDTLDEFEKGALANKALRSPLDAACVFIALHGNTQARKQVMRLVESQVTEHPESAGMTLEELGQVAAEISTIDELLREQDYDSYMDDRRLRNYKQTTGRLASFLWDRFRAKPKEEAGKESKASEKHKELAEESVKHLAEERMNAWDEMLADDEEHEEMLSYRHEVEAHGDSKEVSWGRALLVEDLKLSLPLPPRLRSKRKRASDTGAALRYPHRVMTDMKVFSRTVRRPGGSVLIDMSGSMSLSPEQLLYILEAIPGAVVAAYSGRSFTYRDEEYHGTIRIIAKDGKRARERLLFRPPEGTELSEAMNGTWGASNVVDGPALDWLSKQEEPRFWVSDGGVSGLGEDFSEVYRLDAARKCKRAAIVRLNHVEEVEEAVKQGGMLV